jgi:cytochrome c oxidase assembly protein subunit 15
MRRLQSLAWVTLAYNVAVILWGAGVRATGSGAGCGSHWPLCNGEVVPRAPSVQTVVELTHRLTSGLALVLVVALVIAVFRSRPKGHPARGGAVWSLVFILTEAAVGAGLVLLHLVGANQSLGRAVVMAVHLLNTFLLLGSLALTAHWCGGGAAVRLRGGGSLRRPVFASLGGVMLVGASGAVAALGDTLFPSSSLTAALGQDLSATAHVLVRLRLLHPFIAIAVAVVVLDTAYRVVQNGDADGARRATWTAAFVLAQLIAGLVNVALLAPVWMQIVHLLLADLVWISLVLLAGTVLARDPAREDALAA